MVLEKAVNWAKANLYDETTDGLMLIGSWARNREGDINDIDFAQIKKNQLAAIEQREVIQDDFILDVWVYDYNALRFDLTEPPVDSNQIANISISLQFLLDGEILQERGDSISELKNLAKSYTWDKDTEDLLNFNSTPPSNQFLQKAYEENLILIQLIKEKIHVNKPATFRRKDYPRLNQVTDPSEIQNLFQLTKDSYNKLGITRNWPQFKDAEKALLIKNWSGVLSSIKDVLTYILRYELPSVPDQLIDPNIWRSVENFKINPVTMKAIELAYSIPCS